MNKWIEDAKEILLTIGGHAISGFATAFFYEVVTLMSKGETNWSVLIPGALLGGSLGFFRTIVTELEKLQKPVAVVGGKAKAAPKKFKQYFGF